MQKLQQKAEALKNSDTPSKETLREFFSMEAERNEFAAKCWDMAMTYAKIGKMNAGKNKKPAAQGPNCQVEEMTVHEGSQPHIFDLHGILSFVYY